MAANGTKGPERVVLPDSVIPDRYDLHLAPDLDRFVFDGKVDISVNVAEATEEVKLHAKELQFLSATFKPSEGKAADIEAVCINMNLKETTVTFVFGEVLPVGRGTIHIVYAGILNNQMAGFYRSEYKDAQGNTKMMASTQFESIDARRCLPCWDEPARKAIFSVTLLVDDGLTAIGNMPEKSARSVKVNAKQKREVAFMDSPKMSTYLLAMVVGEFDFVQAQTKNGVLVRVYTPPTRSEAGAFSLDVAVKSLDLYDDFFGVPYPLPKLDMIAIPEFAMGAMENWGLVTYREVDLLIDAKTASSQQKQRVCIVVTHELAHQWFGNLVTMEWWDDLWLNEGFASWCENYAADLVCPDYRVWDQFSSETLVHALKLDALLSSHPIQVPLARAEDVEEVFDAISYCKGASVIRMAHAVLGAEAFREGLRNYMRKHQYGNTVTTDLWAAWSGSSGLDVQALMSTWTLQKGYPLVSVKSFVIDGTTAKVTIEQSWFLSSGEAPPSEPIWQVPLFIQTSAKEVSGCTMMEGKELTLTLDVGTAADAYVLLNAGVQTPMRVAYNADMRTRLTAAIKAGKLSAPDRAGLVMDIHCLAQAGKVGLDEVMRFLTGFYGERDYVVWEALQMVLLAVNRLLMTGAPEHVHKGFKAFASAFVQKGWDTASPGWVAKETDGHMDGLLRGLLMKLVSRFAGEGAWIEEARARFNRYTEDPEAAGADLPDDYKVPVFQAVLSRGGPEEHAKLMKAYSGMSKIIDQNHVQQSIGWTSKTGTKEEVMKFAISGEVKIQDFFYPMMGVANSSREGMEMMWKFFQDNFTHIHGMVKTASPSIMDSVIGCSTSGFCSKEKAQEIEAFFEKHPVPSSKRRIAQILEEMRANAGFLERSLATEIVGSNFWSDLAKNLV